MGKKIFGLVLATGLAAMAQAPSAVPSNRRNSYPPNNWTTWSRRSRYTRTSC